MMKRQSTISRRQFIGSAAAASAALIVPSHVLGGSANSIAPSDKLNIAGIGIGGQGSSDLAQMESENIVALCDVDADYAGRTFERYAKAKRYTDFRKMLDE